MSLLKSKNNTLITTTISTSSYQKKTRNRKRNNTKGLNVNNSNGGDTGCSNVSRGRRKSGENSKIKDEKIQKNYSDIITKPAIESSNPFFIAVCAPETYHKSVATPPPPSTSVSVIDMFSSHGNGPGAGQGQGGRVRSNIFLRSRPRSTTTYSSYTNSSNSNSTYPNRFIHHPVIQNSRHVETKEATPVVNVENKDVLSTDLLHFPTLGKTDIASTSSISSKETKLNFKEMVMKNSSVSATAGTEATMKDTLNSSANVSITAFAPPRYRIFPHKSLSSGNIFLSAFHHQSNDNNKNDDDYDENCDDNNNTGGGGGGFASSSILIDNCDLKYDKLYQ
jgi:hypothetical protein